MDMYIKCWKHCADFSSRASLSEYWHFFFVNIVFTGILSMVAYWLLYDYPIFSKISMCYSFAALLPGLAVCVRRLHDIGRSGWFLLLIFVPVLGLVCLFLLMSLKGENKDNDWGIATVVEPENPTANQ